MKETRRTLIEWTELATEAFVYLQQWMKQIDQSDLELKVRVKELEES